VNAITLGSVWELSVKVRKEEDQRGNEHEREGEAMMWTCYGHVGMKGVSQTRAHLEGVDEQSTTIESIDNHTRLTF
jgi:hypothetical protein